MKSVLSTTGLLLSAALSLYPVPQKLEVTKGKSTSQQLLQKLLDAKSDPKLATVKLAFHRNS